MEIDRYNIIDEIYPYSERTGHLYNNDLGHRVNGSFAKIPLTHIPFGQEMGSRNNFVLNVFHSDPPIQRIDRLKFTFRFHDGRLVDFKNLPFSFTLEFNMLKDEQTRERKHVRFQLFIIYNFDVTQSTVISSTFTPFIDINLGFHILFVL